MSYEQDFWKSVRELQTCKHCRFWMTTLSPEDRAEAAQYENTDGVCDMFNEDGFSPNDYCSRWSARPEDVKCAMEAMRSMHEYLEEARNKRTETHEERTETHEERIDAGLIKREEEREEKDDGENI